MGRPRVIDRERLLDMAEDIARHEGVARLTLGALALAAGVSKGGVQAIFGTKDQLMDALFARWVGEYDSELAAKVGPTPSPLQALGAHIDITRDIDEAEAHRAAGLLTVLLSTADQRQNSDDWYRSRLDLVDLSTAQGRRARIAFLATEGAFFLRCFSLLKMDEPEWHDILDDIRRELLPDDSGKHNQ
ncbi:TetR family transcriptional regulator [Rhodoferax sp. BLA1]|uniref:TetR family transcriptional regulator n=1 Tax=Rhodoferax sp. BLA1 TaxID=2576062 RepID=UPI0015D22D6B|nr:TetR family transcriptional regulator [Rhodoferax sp. BLA1]